MKNTHYLPCNSQIKCHWFALSRDRWCSTCVHHDHCPVLWAYYYTLEIGRDYTWRAWFNDVLVCVCSFLMRGLPH